jgi:hypothetical protein
MRRAALTRLQPDNLLIRIDQQICDIFISPDLNWIYFLRFNNFY